MNPTPGASVRARAPYQSIVDRPVLKLPHDARLVLWTIVNVENWDRPARCRAPCFAADGQPLLPDVPNWCVARVRHAGGLLAHPRGAERNRN